MQLPWFFAFYFISPCGIGAATVNCKLLRTWGVNLSVEKGLFPPFQAQLNEVD